MEALPKIYELGFYNPKTKQSYKLYIDKKNGKITYEDGRILSLSSEVD